MHALHCIALHCVALHCVALHYHSISYNTMTWDDMTWHTYMCLYDYHCPGRSWCFQGPSWVSMCFSGKIQVLPQDSECAHRALRLRERGHRWCVEFPKQRCLVRRLGLFLRGGWSESHWGDDDKPWGERHRGRWWKGWPLGIRPSRDFMAIFMEKMGKLMLHQSHQRVFLRIASQMVHNTGCRCRKRISVLIYSFVMEFYMNLIRIPE